MFLNRGAMSCASLGCKPQDFEFKWDISASHQVGKKRTSGVRGKDG